MLEFSQFVRIAKALIVSDDETVIGLGYCVDAMVGSLPLVV
jgi:hypothetical protein